MQQYLNLPNAINVLVVIFAIWALFCLLTPSSSGSESRLANGVRAVGFLMLAFLLKTFA